MIDIHEIVRLDEAHGRVLGHAIDAPRPGSRGHGYAFGLEGWVVARDGRVESIEVRLGGDVVRQSPIWVSRPDVAQHFTTVPYADASGFRTAVGSLILPPTFELRLDAVLATGERLPLSAIRGRQRRIRRGPAPRLKPLLITSVGRTGTTWLMRLLAEHPGIVSHRTYPYETRVAGYFLRVLRTLTDPANPFDPITPGLFTGTTDSSSRNPMFAVGYAPGSPSSSPDYLAPLGWLEDGYVAGAISFCQRQVSEFYERLAIAQSQQQPVYFAEKYLPNDIPWLVHQIYPEYREIFLIRDFRDVVCSILEFSATRDSARFGVDSAPSDEAYIEGLFRYSALCLLESWQRRSGSAHLVRYEDLILHPSETLASALDYLSLDRSAETVTNMLARARAPLPELDRHRTSRDAVSSIGRWRREMAPRLQETSQRALGDVLRAFGYTDGP